jgi:serine/threonine-protein kinase
LRGSTNHKVTHPNIVRTFDAGSSHGTFFFTMEYAQGITLREKLKAGRIAPYEVAEILAAICDGLSAIHQAEIIHRDLKPGNIIITPEQEVKITDFGVARPGVSDLTGHNEVVGSIAYMPPEVWLNKNVTNLADIYSLGILAYEMLVGEVPFGATRGCNVQDFAATATNRSCGRCATLA